ncbi:MAG: SMP-30/gluconolactonase/LRE family protein [Aggregatilineales bacterium]
MIQRIQNRPKWQRTLIFTVAVMSVILSVCGISYFILYATANSEPRSEPVIFTDNATVREFVALPDDDAYPVALAIAEDGTLYSGSFVTGAVWQIDATGEYTEVSDSRAEIGAVGGLDVYDNALYVLDVGVPLRQSDSAIWRIVSDDTLEKVYDLSPAELASPNDIVLDDDGNIYISDLTTDAIWQLDAEGNLEQWWTAPIENDENPALTGLAYDNVENRLLITDSATSRIYAVDIETITSDILYTEASTDEFPFFEGITVSEDGRIFIAASATHQIAALQDDTLRYLAGGFRNSSDVAYDADRSRLYVANSEQRTLLPENFLTIIPVEVAPHLPFTIDVIEFDASE